MTAKNNPYRRLGRLLHKARNYQNKSLFEVSRQTGISIPNLISVEEARMFFYETNTDKAIDIIQAYAQYLQIDAHSLIEEIALARSVKRPALFIPAFLLKK